VVVIRKDIELVGVVLEVPRVPDVLADNLDCRPSLQATVDLELAEPSAAGVAAGTILSCGP
jgi:hypothetical protein